MSDPTNITGVETANMNAWDAQHFDPKVEEFDSPGGVRVAVIRTSDRINFKRCRRKWGWQSHLKGNLQPKEAIGALWFGTGMHFCLEDYHGYNRYGHPSAAFNAYVKATSQVKGGVPFDHEALSKLGPGMMDYYADIWLRTREPYQTLVVDGVPQVEVKVLIEIPIDLFPAYVREKYDRILYSATFDRVVVDENGDLWIMEYKSAKRIATMHYMTDPQVGAYIWLGNAYYGRPIKGVIYQQHRKDIPEPPRILSDGSISVNKQTATTVGAYRSVVKKICGPDFGKWPSKYVDHLNYLGTLENAEQDMFIRRDKISRNMLACEAEGTKILLEVADMLNPDLPLYPNPIRECAYQCSFLSTCVTLDDGGDWEYELNLMYSDRNEDLESWRNKLPSPPLQPSLPSPQRYQAIQPLSQQHQQSSSQPLFQT